MRQLTEEFVYVASATLLFVPLGLRTMNTHPLAPFPHSYEQILAAAHPGSIYSFILQLLGPWSEFGVLLSVVAGLLALLLLGHLFPLPSSARALLLLTVAVNPLFISTFITLSPLTLAVPLSLLTLLALERRYWTVVPPLCLLVALLSPVTGALLLVLCSLRSPSVRARRAVHFSLAALLLLFFFAHGWFTFVTAPTLSFVELGAAEGLSLFFLLLALGESILLWSSRKLPALLLLVLAALAPFFAAAFVLLGLLSGLYAGLLFVRLRERSWELGAARTLSLLVVACTFLFLIITQATALAEESPTAGLVHVLNAPEEGLVLAPQSHVAYVEAFSTLHPVSVPAEDARALYAAYRLSTARKVLQEHGLTHLLITTKMREGLVWNHEDEGLLRLLGTEAFTLVAQSQDEELWRVTDA